MMRLTVVVSILQYQGRVVGDDGAELQQLHAGVLAGAGKIDHVFGLDAPGELAFHHESVRFLVKYTPCNLSAVW